MGPGEYHGAAERYRAYWRETPDGLFTVRVEPSGRFVFEGLNPALEARSGLSNTMFAGLTPQEAFSPEDAAAIVSRYRQCVERGGPISYPETLHLPKGRLHWETSLAPLRDDTGEIKLLLGTARDVTDRVELQAALSSSAKQLRAVIARVPDILYTAPPKPLPDFVSPRFFDYTGLDPNARVEDWISFVNPDDFDEVMSVMASEQTHLEAEVRLRGRDGEFRWFLVRADVVETPLGLRWFGVATDIHAVKSSAREIEDLNARLTDVLDSISDCYCTVGRDWRLQTANTNAARWFGRPEDQLLGVDIRDWFLSGDVRVDVFDKAMAGRGPFRLEWMSAFRQDRWVELHGYPSADGYGIFFRDVTERRQAQIKVEDARSLLQGSLDAMTAEIALLDRDGRIVAVNEAWRRSTARLGYGWPQHGVGASFVEVCRQAIEAFDEAAVARALRDLPSGRMKRFSRAFVLGAGAHLRWYQQRITQFQKGAETYFVAAHEDVTEVARAQAALREISGKLLSVQEDERQRIAVELHDSTSQHLVALGLGVARLRRTLDPDGRADSVLDDMAGSLDEALKEIRVLSYLMNPPNLERDGLATTARNFVDGFGRRTGLHTAFRLEGPLEDFSLDVQRTVFRVIQEALSNVHRHARANGVEVELTQTATGLSLRIADDGCGIEEIHTPSFPGAQLGVGISGMRARVEQLGGMLTIGRDGAGTVLRAAIPWSATAVRRARPRKAPVRPPVARPAIEPLTLVQGERPSFVP